LTAFFAPALLVLQGKTMFGFYFLWYSLSFWMQRIVLPVTPAPADGRVYHHANLPRKLRLILQFSPDLKGETASHVLFEAKVSKRHFGTANASNHVEFSVELLDE